VEVLAVRLARLIREAGPLTLAQYMTLCLHDPVEGYYATRPALGEGGDFITSPEITQMFGEMVGIWVLSVWDAMGRPACVRLVELGPGSGVLMSDLLRAAGSVPSFLDAADLWLVEASEPLREAQKVRLAGRAASFAGSLDEVPAGAPLIVVGNEFLDCFGARQFVRRDGAWHEHRIGVDEDGRLVLGLAPAPSGLAAPEDAPEGAVLEVSPAQEAIAEALAQRIVRDGGAVLLLDYGRDRPGLGDTFQALAGHRKVDPLEAPGTADLTVHVDFPAVVDAARRAGARVTPIVTQTDFLARMGIAARADALVASATRSGRTGQVEVIRRQLARITDPAGMGGLFKALAIHALDADPPGFADSGEAP
jgi:NADH dehydrogenase [ubiquinone] 1 alpha subcomplex assembly factor 7